MGNAYFIMLIRVLMVLDDDISHISLKCVAMSGDEFTSDGQTGPCFRLGTFPYHLLFSDENAYVCRY